MQHSATNLVWIDLEMTGLDPDTNRIMEIATVVTDKYLEVIAEGPVLALHLTDTALEKMDAWCVKQHGLSGLTERVKQSHISVKQAEEETLKFLAQYVPPGKSPMCGNSICQDRRFLYRYMPELEKFFHYRNFDVSVLKIIAKSWYPDIAKAFKKKTKHMALSDIYDSVAEMKYYMENVLRPFSNG